MILQNGNGGISCLKSLAMLLTMKLLMTPLLIAFVTLVGRKWGPGVGGWLMGFPLTSGPVSMLPALPWARWAGRARIFCEAKTYPITKTKKADAQFINQRRLPERTRENWELKAFLLTTRRLPIWVWE
jgi:hypothetical protein